MGTTVFVLLVFTVSIVKLKLTTACPCRASTREHVLMRWMDSLASAHQTLL